MTEFGSHPERETSHEDLDTIRAGLYVVCKEVLYPEDLEYVLEEDSEAALGYVYGRLIEIGEDPDEVLRTAGVIE